LNASVADIAPFPERRELLRVDDHLSDLLAFTGRPE
jgi:hypothetical protein